MSEKTAAPNQPLVTPLVSIAEQVGQHVLQSLRSQDCVAVISTMVPGMGPGADRIVSMPLTSEQMVGVNHLIESMQAELDLPEEEQEGGCIGFQCQIPPEES